jgi:hypothetical protein
LSNYTKSTNFATKDNLSPGDPLKIVRGTEIDTEFNNISTAISTKTDNSAAAITGGSITGITDLAIADGGTGASTATAAINNLLPAQTSAANKYLQSDGTNVSWDAVTLSTADITGTLPVANGGTGVTSSTGTGSVVLSNSPTLVTPALGTPASGVATNLTGLPISTGVSGLGTGVATFLATPSSANLASAVSDETGSGALVFANSPTLVTPALGTPSALVGTNITGTASGLTAGNVTTNANLTGAVTSVGNATSLGSFTSSQLAGALTDETGTGSAVFATSPTLVTPILGTPTSATLTNATGLPIATGVSGLGTGVATALAVNVGSAGAPVVNGGALGTPSSGTVTNLTGTASININGTVGATTATTGAFTTLAASSTVTLSGGTANGVTYLNGSKVLTSGSALTFDGTNTRLGIGGNPSVTGIDTGVTNLLVVGTNNNTGAAATFVTDSVGRGIIVVDQAKANALAVFMGSGIATLSTTTSGTNLAFSINNSEQMRLTSTGLGIGTSSPAYKLDVLSTGVPAQFSSSNASNTLIQHTNTNASKDLIYRFRQNAGAGNWYDLTMEGATNAFTIDYNDTTRITLDSAGNLGLGVTPSAWSTASSTRAMQFPGGGTVWGQNFGGSNPSIQLACNAYLDSVGYKYFQTAPASQYQQNAGTHAWQTAASGTAGDAISFTQAMTLTSAGALLVGTTSNPNAYRQVLSFDGATVGGLDFLDTFSPSGTTVACNFRRAGTSVGSITTTLSLTLYNTTSDQRLKENIVDAPEFGSVIDSIKVRSFDWKTDSTHQRAGFIAQELVTVAPEAVHQPTDTKEMMAVDYSKLVPMLVKEIQSLRQRVAQLETN